MPISRRIAVSTHEKNLRQMRCCVCGSPEVTLHHVHGGSIKLNGWHVGMGQKQNPFLQIPLHQRYHTGAMGIDSGYGVVSWEQVFGNQTEHLQWVNEQLDYDIYREAVWWENAYRVKNRSIAIKRLGKILEHSTAKQSDNDTEN